jgi:hypothetical protein
MHIMMFEKNCLAQVIEELRMVVSQFDEGNLRVLRIADDGGLKVKSNGGMWSPPYFYEDGRS